MIEKRIGQRIKLLRKRKGWTRADLARETGLSEGYIAAVERGEVKLSIRAIAIIAGKLGVSIREILT